MLDYLMRREQKPEQPNTDQGVGGNKPAPDESAKQAALLEADQFAGDEAGAVSFILQCGFADARLRAAEHIHGRPALEQVLQAMRKVDRRVAKLSQTRLDAIVKHELITKHADESLGAARRLLEEVPLMPNRVADIDRAWRSIGEVDAPLQAQFDVLRTQMESRLAAQAALQRSVIDALEGMRKLIAGTDKLSPEQAAETMNKIAQDWKRYRNAPESPSLPRHLVSEFEQAYQSLAEKQGMRSQQAEAAAASVTARETLLARWESADAASLNVIAMKREWADLPLLENDAGRLALQQRFDALLDKAVSRTEKPSLSPELKNDKLETFLSALQAMEQAIEGGHLQEVMAQEETLRKLEKQLPRLQQAQVTRLVNARAGLKRLQGWARWSGNMSRDALIKTVADLPAQKISLQELAKVITGARENWKALDTQSGAAPKALWERFDAACTTAYTPIAEHSKKQAQARQQNKERAEALIADARKFIDKNALSHQGEQTSDQASQPEWKRVAGFYQGITQSWHRIGHMDRKDKKRLDAEFSVATQVLLQPLRQRWDLEIENRKRLIQEVEQLDASDRKAVDTLRKIQQRWQESAKTMPLERNEEQVLWLRFRTACDAVFAHRKVSNAAADAERHKNAESKEALCTTLEAAQNESEAVIKELLRKIEISWKQAGPVPHAKEQKIETRYRKALSALQTRLKATAHAAKQAQRDALIEKMTLCRAVESAVVANMPYDNALDERWQSFPSLPVAQENLIRKRFDAAKHALTTADKKYASILEENREALLKGLLRAEIMSGMESPPELSRQRLEAQVAVLQSSLSGKNALSLTETINGLCSLPALSDEASMARMERLLKKTWRDNAP